MVIVCHIWGCFVNTNQRMGWGTPREAGGNSNTPPPITRLAYGYIHFSAQLSQIPDSTSKRTPGNIVCTASSIAVSTSALISSAVSLAHSTISSSCTVDTIDAEDGSLPARSTIACLSASAEPPCTGVFRSPTNRIHSVSFPSGNHLTRPETVRTLFKFFEAASRLHSCHFRNPV